MHVPGLFYVATKFFHVCFLPLIPLRSWIVIDTGALRATFAPAWTGIELNRLVGRSWWMAWVRVFLLWVITFDSIMVGVATRLFKSNGPIPMGPTIPIAILIVAIGLLWLSYKTGKATREQIERLKATPGVPADLIDEAMKRLRTQCQ